MNDCDEKVQKCLGYLAAKLEECRDMKVGHGYLLLLSMALKEQTTEIWKANNTISTNYAIIEKTKKENETLKSEVERLKKKSYPIDKYKKTKNKIDANNAEIARAREREAK